ncbi:MAG: acetyl-CoA carboxylase, carboxyltransferase subunit beta [Turicibacter sp.]|nr:acetyl-CoA carboxylase, carboxyltransferase subunit beta [Turicibacter sp.]
MGFFLQRQKKIKSSASKRDINDGIYTKCESCKEVIAVRQLNSNLEVCPSCGFHHRMSAKKRLESLIDAGTFKEINHRLCTRNPLGFPGYEKKIQHLMKENDLNEAIVTGIGKINGQTVAIGVMDSHFLMASMGSVVGEKVTRLIEISISRKLPLVIVCASGGARMQEGIYSLMQMAKTSEALAKHNQAGLLYLSVLTQPTMGGVTASFATLGDIIIAEQGAMIGFAGRRVVEQTIKQSLPDHFQTAEFLQEKGLVDLVVSRHKLKQTISNLVELHEGSEA